MGHSRFNPGFFRIVRSNLKLILLFAFLQTFLQYTITCGASTGTYNSRDVYY